MGIPHESHGHDHALTYIEASARTATRSREILILIIIVSVLVFGAFWNSRQGSWISERIRIHNEVLALVQQERVISTLAPRSPERLAAQIALMGRQYDRAREFVAARPALRDPDAVRLAKERLQNILTEHVLYLKVPFFGLLIDVNDLGMLGGFTFIVLLLWFRSSLWHESQNLKITFADTGADGDARFYYTALAMQQVLTTPPLLDERSTKHDHWSVIVKGLLLLPLAIHFTVFCYDSMSFGFGWTVSPSNTIISMSVSAVFLTMIAWLTYLCFVLLADIAETWKRAALSITNPIAGEVLA